MLRDLLRCLLYAVMLAPGTRQPPQQQPYNYNYTQSVQNLEKEPLFWCGGVPSWTDERSNLKNTSVFLRPAPDQGEGGVQHTIKTAAVLWRTYSLS